MQGRRWLAYAGLVVSALYVLWLLVSTLVIPRPIAGGIHIGDLYATEGTTMQVQDGALNVLPGVPGEFGLVAPVIQSINLAFTAVFFLAVLIGSVLLLRATTPRRQQVQTAPGTSI